jgi:hypothetical protein
LRDALARVEAGGSTAIAPAVEMAASWLNDSGRTATKRQVLLISDGRTNDEDAARLRALARARRVEISVVALGDTANRGLLEDLAALSGGRAYFPATIHELPRAVAREAARSSSGGTVQEPFTPAAVSHAVFTGIDTRALPRLGGYVVSAAKPGADGLLTSHLGDPVLASWRTGVGRVAVYTADLGSPWSAGVRAWSQGGQLWAQTVRWLGRQPNDGAMGVTLRDSPDGPRLEVDAIDAEGAPLSIHAISVIVRAPDDTVTTLALDPVEPGRYVTARCPGPAVTRRRSPRAWTVWRSFM